MVVTRFNFLRGKKYNFSKLQKGGVGKELEFQGGDAIMD